MVKSLNSQGIFNGIIGSPFIQEWNAYCHTFSLVLVSIMQLTYEKICIYVFNLKWNK